MIREALRQALRTLRAERVRTSLTLFGIVWGTASVIFLMGWGEGLRIMIETSFERSGKNMAQVWPGSVGEDFTPAADRRYLWYELDDVAALRSRARLPDAVAGEARQWGTASYRSRTLNVNVRGIEPDVMAIRGVSIASGRGITRSDVELRKRVAVLGVLARERLLGLEGGVGSRLRLNGESFRVVGLLERVGQQLAFDAAMIDEQIWIPITSHAAVWPKSWTQAVVADRILFRVADRGLYDAARAEVRAVLADRMRVSASDDEANGVFSSIDALRRIPLDRIAGLMLLLGVGTLLVGGIGVLTLMLDAVQERRAEIGVRIAVGARRRDIVLQFFLETLAITAIGGAVGLAFGVLGCLGLAALDAPDLVPIPRLLPGVVEFAVAFVVAVGTAAGVLPAWRAARVDPAQTLRTE